MIIPKIKEIRQAAPINEQEIVFALKNEKPKEFELIPRTHKYVGLKRAFLASILWLFLGFPVAVWLMASWVPTKGHIFLGLVMISWVLMDFFIFEMFWGGGDPSKRSGL